MGKHTAWPTEARTRPRRWLWPDRNPLRRRCDRAEATIMAALMAAFLTGAPLLVLAAGHWPHVLGSPFLVIAVLALPFGFPVLLLAAMSASVTLAVVVGPVALAAQLGCIGLAVHGLLDSRRMAAWDAEWSVTGSRWTIRP